MRVLLLRAGALGDLLLLRPALAALRGAGHRVALIAPERPASALGGDVDELFPWERPELAALLAGRPSGALDELLRRCERVIAFTRSQPLLRALAATGASLRSQDPSPPAGRHAADWLAEAVREAAPLALLAPAPLQPSQQERDAASAVVGRLPPDFLAVHPGSGSPAKNWPRERFRSLVDRIGVRPFLLVRGEADADACTALAQHARAVVANDLPVRVLGAALSQAGLFVGNDSGVSHLAAAFGAPTLALFGPTDPRSWRPLGPSAQALASSTGAMEGLEVDAVLTAARELLARCGRELPSG